MRKLLPRALLVTALSSASMMAFADGFGIPYYARGPRIIHVPQPGDDLRDSRSSLDNVAPEEDDDDVVSALPPPSRRVVKPVVKPQKTAVRTSPREPPRRKPFSVSLPEPPSAPPEPLGPRRALLSAPPPPPTSSIHDGPTPLRPTPRFGAALPEPVAAEPASASQPAESAAADTSDDHLPPPASDPVTVSMPVPEPAARGPANTSDDHLPPPGDPRLAPPEPKS